MLKNPENASSMTNVNVPQKLKVLVGRKYNKKKSRWNYFEI